MSKIVDSMLDHPLASMFIISTTLCGISNIILACRGLGVNAPGIYITNTKPVEESK